MKKRVDVRKIVRQTGIRRRWREILRIIFKRGRS